MKRWPLIFWSVVLCSVSIVEKVEGNRTDAGVFIAAAAICWAVAMAIEKKE